MIGASAAISGAMAAAMRFAFQRGGPLATVARREDEAYRVPAVPLTAMSARSARAGVPAGVVRRQCAVRARLVRDAGGRAGDRLAGAYRRLSSPGCSRLRCSIRCRDRPARPRTTERSTSERTIALTGVDTPTRCRLAAAGVPVRYFSQSRQCRACPRPKPPTAAQPRLVLQRTMPKGSFRGRVERLTRWNSVAISTVVEKDRLVEQSAHRRSREATNDRQDHSCHQGQQRHVDRADGHA